MCLVGSWVCFLLDHLYKILQAKFCSLPELPHLSGFGFFVAFIAGAEPSSVNHAGFSPWMVVAEVDTGPSPRADDIRECLELLKPKMLPEELLQAEMPEETQLLQ